MGTLSPYFPFDEITLLVPMTIILSRIDTIASRWNDRLRSLGLDSLNKMVCVISFVGDYHVSVHSINQGMCLANIRFLTGSQKTSHRVAQSINGGMNLGCQSSFGPANGLRAVFFSAPAAC